MQEYPKQHPANNQPGEPESGPGPRGTKKKKTARVVCAGNSEFWTTQKQFWAWVRDGIVTHLGDNPLTGKFEGRREKLIIMINHVLLDASVPDHKDEVLHSYVYKKPRRHRMPERPPGKRPR